MTAKLPTILLLAVLTVLFYWKTLLTNQYTLLRVWEGITQGYGWLSFSVRSLRQGHLPLWDPYTFYGHTFLGEMQTSGLSPINLLVALSPTNSHGLLPVLAYHVLFAFLHFLGLAFGYALARELRLRPVAAIVAGLCFSMGGFLERVLDWPDLLQSGIWLPLIMLFLIRALRARDRRSQLYSAAVSGLVIGLAILGGRLHMVIMEVIVVVTASAFYVWQRDWEAEDKAVSDPEPALSETTGNSLRRHALLVAVVGAVALGAGAFQLFPSMSYAPKAIHYFGEHSAPANEKIPYAYLTTHAALPNSVVGFVLPFGFNGNLNQAEFLLPYVGILPLFLAIYALLTLWPNAWVRYFGFLALACTLYSFGQFSPLHGLLYAIVPKLWWMREPGRIVYLTSFALAMLAGYGADALFRPLQVRPAFPASAVNSVRFFDWSALALVISSAAILLIGAIFNYPVNPWVQLSMVLIFMSYGLYRGMVAGHVGVFTKFLAVFVIMFDLASFDWTMQRKIDLAKDDEFVKLLSCENPARFLKSLPGPFRLDIDAPNAPAMGDVFQILTTKGDSATLMANMTPMLGRRDLLNVEYVMKTAAASDPNPVYQDDRWKIFRTPNPYHHGWLVHSVQILPAEEAFSRLYDPSVDYLQVATSVDALDRELDHGTSASEAVQFTSYRENELKLAIKSNGRALLVLSEIYDEDWTAKVNGKPAAIHQVDGGLRGIVVPDGQSTVVLNYLPLSVIFGGILTAITFIAMFAFWFKMRRTPPAAVAARTARVPVSSHV